MELTFLRPASVEIRRLCPRRIPSLYPSRFYSPWRPQGLNQTSIPTPFPRLLIHRSDHPWFRFLRSRRAHQILTAVWNEQRSRQDLVERSR